MLASRPHRRNEINKAYGLSENEAAYEYIPSDDIIEHEVAAALNGVYRF